MLCGFSKAFDSVNREALFYKMKQVGITGKMNITLSKAASNSVSFKLHRIRKKKKKKHKRKHRNKRFNNNCNVMRREVRWLERKVQNNPYSSEAKF